MIGKTVESQNFKVSLKSKRSQKGNYATSIHASDYDTSAYDTYKNTDFWKSNKQPK